MIPEGYKPLPEREKKTLLKADLEYLWDEVEKRGGVDGWSDEETISATALQNLAAAVIGRQGSRAWADASYSPSAWSWGNASDVPLVDEWSTDASQFEAGESIRLKPVSDMFDDISAMSRYVVLYPSYSLDGWTQSGPSASGAVWAERSTYGSHTETNLTDGTVTVSSDGVDGEADVAVEFLWSRGYPSGWGYAYRTFTIGFSDGVGEIGFADIKSVVADIRSHYGIGPLPDPTSPGTTYSSNISLSGIRRIVASV